jgi:hypothetical protein
MWVCPGMRLRMWCETFPGLEAFSNPQWLHRLMGLRGHEAHARCRVEAGRGFCLFEEPEKGSRRCDTRASNATGKEGSTRGQVEKTEDFAQIQPQDKIRRQVEAEPRRFKGGHHNLGGPRWKYQRLQAHGAGHRDGRPEHLEQG